MQTTVRRVLILAALFWLAAAGSARAHRVNVFARAEDGVVKVEAYFSGGAGARDADVVVYGADGTERRRLKTDADGRCSFRPDRVEDLRIVVTAGDGHRAEFALKASEFGGGTAPEPKVPPLAAGPSREAVPCSPGPGEAQGPEARIRDLQRQFDDLRKSRQEISARDVIAGLAFIFATTALAMALWRRRGADRGP